MGCVSNVTATTFPKQGDDVGRLFSVVFHYDTTKPLLAVCVRHDTEEPYVMIFRLENGRHVLGTECQYQPLMAECEGLT